MWKTISNSVGQSFETLPSIKRVTTLDLVFSWSRGFPVCKVVENGKMSLRNLRYSVLRCSCGWWWTMVLSFVRSILSRIVNNVSGEISRVFCCFCVSFSFFLFFFFPSTIHTARRSTPCWLIETVVEGTIACNCSFRETEAPFRFLRTMARSAFRSLRSRQVFSPRSISLFTVDRVY